MDFHLAYLPESNTVIGVQVAAEILAITANLKIVYYIPGIVIST